MNDDEPCTAFFNYPVLDFPTTIYIYTCLCAALRDACVGMRIVVLGMCGEKPAGEGTLGTLTGVSLKQPIWDRG
jgi:hypothetical protein